MFESLNEGSIDLPLGLVGIVAGLVSGKAIGLEEDFSSCKSQTVAESYPYHIILTTERCQYHFDGSEETVAGIVSLPSYELLRVTLEQRESYMRVR